MPYNKGDFTQQGINGDVSALVRLNEKRVMKVVLSSDDESDNCDISGAVYDLLNGTSYSVGSAPSGTIEITANGTGIDVSQYALADVNVSGGGGDSDWTWANVTLRDTIFTEDFDPVEGYIVACPILYNNDYGPLAVLNTGSILVQIPLYKGQTVLSVSDFPNLADDNGSYDITGDITKVEEQFFTNLVITGDCSLGFGQMK